MFEGIRRWWAGGRPSESDLDGQIQWAVDRRLGLADYQGLPAVARARSLIVSQVAQLDLVAYRDGMRLETQPRIVTRPAPGMTRDAFVGMLAGELFDRSNAYLWLPSTGRDADGQQTTAVVLPFDDVAVTWDSSQTFRRYRWRDRELYPGRDLLHVELPGRRPDELLVPSKFDVCADALDRILAAELYAGDYFDNGGVPTVALKWTRGDLTDDEAALAKARWVETHRTHSPAVLSASWELSEVGGNPDTAQLLETRAAGTLEVARIWGIVPAELLLAVVNGSSLTYQNIAGMLDTLVRVTVQPEYLAPIEAALSDLVARTQAVRFSTAELFRLNETERIPVEVQAIGAGIYTLPEVRRAHGLPDSSTPTTPAALAPVPRAPDEVPVP